MCTSEPRGLLLLLAACLLLSLLPGRTAWGGVLERLLMPGPLAEAHARYEAKCGSCHDTAGKAPQRAACLDCHDKVQQDIEARQGFHGRTSRAVEGECRQCHSEHQGRSADIVGLVPSLFDHGATDFALKGAHRTTDCVSCHAAGKPHREAPHACVACHKADDVHRAAMGRQCQDCHDQQHWQKAEFDHDKTDFPLHNKHAKVACAVCHPGQRYKDTPTACGTCHRSEDRHGGLFGDKCETCHTEKSWKKASFDHAAKTDFPLRGRHAGLTCHSCHDEKSRGRKLPLDCQGCHRQADIHQGRFGEECADCHDSRGWGGHGFDHDKDAGFALLGRHREVPCNTCHGGRQVKTAGRRLCVDCHRVDDVHKGSLGDRCDNCHGSDGWSAGVRFDHDLGRFPLVGMHAITACAECHLDRAYVDTPQACVVCHKAADVHKGTMGEHCSSCHNPNSWRRWVFDHDKATDYPLLGKHRGAACNGCHREPVKDHHQINLGNRCIDCHATDDVHGGGFGTACERCHQPSSFLDLDIQR